MIEGNKHWGRRTKNDHACKTPVRDNLRCFCSVKLTIKAKNKAFSFIGSKLVDKKEDKGRNQTCEPGVGIISNLQIPRIMGNNIFEFGSV